MATKVYKTRNTSKGTYRKEVSKVAKNDLKDQAMKYKHDLAMARVNNIDYQKEITKRMAGVTAGTTVATPTTTALANTNAFSSGGFNVDSSSNAGEEESDSSNKVWGH